MNDVGHLSDRIRRAAFERLKRARRAIRGRPDSQRIVLIVGCQRSGTTMLTRIFERDLSARIFPERSEVTTQDAIDRIRLNDLELVRELITTMNDPLVVLKPLVESQRTLELLQGLPGSVAIWIYRDYRDVALSNRKRFGELTAVDDIRPIVNDEGGNWRSERVSAQTRSIVSKHFSDDMNGNDAALLFWYARNALYFDQELASRADVMLCKYEDLVADPAVVCERIYRFIGRPFRRRLVAGVHDRSVERGSAIDVSATIETLARQMLIRLDRCYADQNRRIEAERR